MRHASRILWAALAALAGCTGSIGGHRDARDDRAPRSPGGDEDENGDDDDATSPPLPPPAACSPDVGPQVLRRLTSAEYRRSLSALFPGLTMPMLDLPSDTAAVGYTSQTAPVNDLALAAYLDAGAAIAAAVAKTPGIALAGCDLEREGEAACIRAMLERVGRRAFRRPLTVSELGKLQAVFDMTRAGDGFATALASTVERLLAHPAFLYRIELGTPAPEIGDDVYRLDGYELASRLAFLLSQSSPDDWLLDAARDGELGRAGGLAAAARRLLADQRAADVLWDFHREWLHLDHLNEIIKDPNAFPSFDDALRASMLEETRRFVVAAFADGRATLDELLRGRATIIDGSLASLYGVSGVDAGQWQTVDLPNAGGRAGLLGQASFLTAHATSSDSSIIHRGVMVRTQVLCLPVPKPSPDIDIDPKVDRLRTAPCSACHQIIDPVGQAFEHFDGIGRYRTETAAGAVNARGALVGTHDIDGPIAGFDDLTRKLVGSADTASCLAQQWFQFAFARAPTDEDACSLSLARSALESSGGDVVAMLSALVEGPAFRLVRRAPATREVCE